VKTFFPARAELLTSRKAGRTLVLYRGKEAGNKRRIKSACQLGRVTAAEESGLIFRDLLPTMDVDFVRSGQSTVVLFPFSCLRGKVKTEGRKKFSDFRSCLNSSAPVSGASGKIIPGWGLFHDYTRSDSCP